jgi:uncharacterized OB-fold protein
MAETASVHTRAGQEQLRERGIRPVPCPDDLTRPYWEGAAAHRLRIMRCLPCGELRHPPAPECPACGADRPGRSEWTDVGGRGTVYSYIVDYRLLMPGFDEPYVIVQVVPAEAARDTVRITANLLDCPLDAVRVGMAVEAVFEQVRSGVTLPQFRPAGPTSPEPA